MKSLVLFLVGILLITALASLIVPPFILRAQPAEEILVERLEQITGRSLEFQSFKLSHFPFIMVHLQNARLTPKRSSSFQIEAAEVKIKLARLPLLVGRMEIAEITLSGGNLQFEFPAFPHYELIRVNDAELKLGALTARDPIPFSLKGAVNNIGDAVTAEGVFSVDSLEKWSWLESSFETTISVHQVQLDGMKKILKDLAGIEAASGSWTGTWNVAKKSGEERFGMDGQIEVQDFSYYIHGENQGAVSPKMNVSAEYDLYWDPRYKLLQLEQLSLTLPAGRVSTEGVIDWEGREVRDMRIIANEVALETIPHYFSGLKEAIPFNIGFSGLSNMEVSVSGNWDNLSLHVNWDLTQALLTYARYFSKPKSYPLNVTFDYLLTDSSILSGDFSVRINNVTMKGTLTDLDLKTGDGQINIITNKFPLEGWEKLLPPIEKFTLGGQAKILTNFEGKLQKLYETKTTFNMSVENGKITSPRGSTIHDINFAFDLSPLSFDMKEARIAVDDSTLSGGLLVYGLQQRPIIKLYIASEDLDAASTAKVLDDFASEWLTPAESKIKNAFMERLLWLFPEGERLSKLSLNAEYENKIWTLPGLLFGAYHGDWISTGSWDMNEWPGTYKLEGNIQKLNLNRFYKRGGSEEEAFMEGNLFLKFDVGGLAGETWIDSMQGTGALLITNGIFHTFDLFGTIGKMADFEAMSGRSNGATPFHDVHSPLEIVDRKILMQDLAVLMEDSRIQASGETTFKGLLNYRLDVFLSPDFFPSEEEKPVPAPGEEEDYLGPVPLLLSGPVDNPELKPDLPQVSNLLGRLLKRKPEKALDTFLSEDFFLEQWKNS